MMSLLFTLSVGFLYLKQQMKIWFKKKKSHKIKWDIWHYSIFAQCFLALSSSGTPMIIFGNPTASC